VVAGALVGAVGAAGLHAWSRAAAPETRESRRRWRRRSMGITS
jgi:hypothetical protein